MPLPMRRVEAGVAVFLGLCVCVTAPPPPPHPPPPSPTRSACACMSMVEFTDEQRYIVGLARPPNSREHQTVRITAGAGTGKTSTLRALVPVLRDLGHQPWAIAYTAYGKTAAADAQGWAEWQLPKQRAKAVAATTHSFAWRLLGVRQQTTSESALMRKCAELFMAEILEFLQRPGLRRVCGGHGCR